MERGLAGAAAAAATKDNGRYCVFAPIQTTHAGQFEEQRRSLDSAAACAFYRSARRLHFCRWICRTTLERIVLGNCAIFVAPSNELLASSMRVSLVFLWQVSATLLSTSRTSSRFARVFEFKPRPRVSVFEFDVKGIQPMPTFLTCRRAIKTQQQAHTRLAPPPASMSYSYDIFYDTVAGADQQLQHKLDPSQKSGDAPRLLGMGTLLLFLGLLMACCWYFRVPFARAASEGRGSIVMMPDVKS